MFSIEVTTAEIKRSKSGSITGPIRPRMGNVDFPDENWNDFVVVILGWWAREAASVASGAKKRGELLFMDGPFFVAVTAFGDTWRLECTRRSKTGTALEHEATANSRDVARAVLATAEQVISACTQSKWQCRDLDELRSARDALLRAVQATE